MKIDKTFCCKDTKKISKTRANYNFSAKFNMPESNDKAEFNNNKKKKGFFVKALLFIAGIACALSALLKPESENINNQNNKPSNTDDKNPNNSSSIKKDDVEAENKTLNMVQGNNSDKFKENTNSTEIKEYSTQPEEKAYSNIQKNTSNESNENDITSNNNISSLSTKEEDINLNDFKKLIYIKQALIAKLTVYIDSLEYEDAVNVYQFPDYEEFLGQEEAAKLEEYEGSCIYTIDTQKTTYKGLPAIQVDLLLTEPLVYDKEDKEYKRPKNAPIYSRIITMPEELYEKNLEAWYIDYLKLCKTYEITPRKCGVTGGAADHYYELKMKADNSESEYEKYIQKEDYRASYDEKALILKINREIDNKTLPENIGAMLNAALKKDSSIIYNLNKIVDQIKEKPETQKQFEELLQTYLKDKISSEEFNLKEIDIELDAKAKTVVVEAEDENYEEEEVEEEDCEEEDYEEEDEEDYEEEEYEEEYELA